MISFDDHPPSDPSSSHHHHQQQQQKQQNPHDLKVSAIDLKSTDADLVDTNNPLPNFSIRDYVFGLRSKNIACNWPFSPKSLQLCLKHGVKNVLPPFQSLDSLRNNSSLTRCSLENRLTDEELVSSFDGNPINDQVEPNPEIVSTNSIGLREDNKESQFHLKPQSGQTKPKEKPPSSSEKTENASVHTIIKKSRLVVKVNSGVEHIAVNSESMASKVCPVCKIFSSSSNTTLNAHIDQCLTGEGTMKWTENSKVIVKHKVRPRKMRLMGDIYKTAPHCTVEELDRRNGTSWATNSSFSAQEFQFQGEEAEEKEEREEPKTTTNNPEVGDNEGDVYIDTNGTKVRILSVTKPSPSDKLGGRKLLKGVKRSKMIMGKKKNVLYEKKHQKKYLKLSPKSRKLCSPKPQIVGEQAKSGEGEDVGIAQNCTKDERGRENMKVVDLGIIRPPWACSKRTGLSKKFNGKNQKVELQCHEKKDFVVESDKSSSGCDLGTPRSLSDIVGSSQSTKKMRTSLSLIKQPQNRMVKFRKEGTRMHDDDDDDDDHDADVDDDVHDNDDECEGSLVACPSQHSDDANTRSKGSKVSSLSKNLSFPGSKFNYKRKFSAVDKSCIKSVDGPSSKEQSRMEEQVSEKKKQETRSKASKSSKEESSVGVQTVDGDELESVRNEKTLSILAPSFTGLSTSFNPEFSKQECIAMYQDQICSTNRAPNDVEKQENYFQEVDPIPIPGPPGSFLPASPGGEIVSEEHIQAARGDHSSENQQHHDTMDHDSRSNSPVSTVSNSRSTSAQEDTYKKPFFNGNTGYSETGQSHISLKNDQPCCCTRKEFALNYQNSYFVMKQPFESNKSNPSSFNFKSEPFSVRNNQTSPAPDSAASPSKPVLRLMGKNLMVNNTSEEDESLSLQSRPPRPSEQHPQRPAIFSQYQNGFESHPLVHMRSHVDSMRVHGGFMAPVDGYHHEDSYLGLGPRMHQGRFHHGHNVLDSLPSNGRNVYNAASSSRPVKEVIIIDDSPENEADVSTRNESFRRNQGQMNPLYTMYSSYGGGGGRGGGSSAFRGGSFQTSLANADLGSRWNIGSSTAYYPPRCP